MNRILYRIICLTLCMAMLFTLDACGDKKDEGSSSAAETEEETTEAAEPKEPESATELWERIDETMNSVGSYEVRSVMQFTYYYMGIKFDASSVGDGVYCAAGGETYSYEDSTTDVVCTELSMSQRRESVEAYYDGRMYISNTEGDSSQKFCSVMTYDEFKETDEGVLASFDLLACTNKDFVKNEDGSWALAFSGYTKKAINVFLYESGMTEDDMGADVLDMEISVDADSEFHAVKVLISLVFDVEEDSTAVPVLIAETEYKGFDCTEPNYDELKTEEYTEIEDVRILGKVTDSLEKYKGAKSGTFVVDAREVVTAFGEDTVYEEKDTVTFEEKDGGYNYEILLESSDGDGTFSYKNGVQDITYGEEEYSQAQTDEEAREFIYGLMDVAEYDEARVTAVKKKDENSYVFEVAHPEDAVYADYFESMGVEYESMKQTITVTMENDTVKKMESAVEVQGVYNDVAGTEPVTMTSLSTIVFGEDQYNAVNT